jgi:hypothetical protein
MCTIPKVGSSTWRKFMLYLSFPELTYHDGLERYRQKYGIVAGSHPDAHNISKNGVKLMALQTPEKALEYYSNKKYLKVFHVRNPITRVLSAWLSKNAVSSNPLPFAKYSPTFEIFIQVSSPHHLSLSLSLWLSASASLSLSLSLTLAPCLTLLSRIRISQI